MISERRKNRIAKEQSKRAKRQLRHNDGRFKAERKGQKFADLKSKKGHSDGIVTIEYEKRKVDVGGKDYYIPVDDSGHVPRTALAARLQHITEGNRKGIRRNVIRDLNSDAQTVVKGDKLTPEEVAEWWAHPNESDIEGIDTTKDWASLKGYSQKKYDSAKNIVLLDVGKKEDAAIRKILMDSFTKGELDKMASEKGVTVIVDRNISGAGQYDPTNKVIRLRPEFASAGGTITHEFTHHLRLKDKKRTGEVTKSSIRPGMTAEDVNLEEAATVAETITRLTPYHKVENVSYHGHLAGEDEKKARTFIEKDRKTFVGNSEVGSKGLRGKRAINAVEKKFDQSEIANLRYNTKESAKETVKKKIALSKNEK